MSGGYDTDLLRRLRLFGLDVTEVDGWRTRGAASLAIKGAVGHHTGGAAKGVQPSLGVVINGRADLPGPLCNVHGPREESRRVNLVAAGRANHAGVGDWRGITGNSSVGGLEEEHTGSATEAMSPLRVERFCRVIAAMIDGKAPAEMACMHWEWAKPAGRKPDFVKVLIPAATMRARVAQLLIDPGLPWPDDQENDDMTAADVAAINQHTDEQVGRLAALLARTPADGGFSYAGTDLNACVVRPDGTMVQAVYFGKGEERVLARGLVPTNGAACPMVRDVGGVVGRLDVFGFYPKGGYVIATFDPKTAKWGTADFARP